MMIIAKTRLFQNGILTVFFFVVCLDNVQRECYPGEWPCPSSGVCIPFDHLCDGTVHCPDGEDETNTTAGRNCSQLPPS